ncbi:MAG: acyl-CoA carboxylase epsilon subunit [Acidimicrobiales bacterium]
MIPDITPTPTDEEAAAIVAALTLAAAPAPAGDEPVADPRWRFSGRWWNRPTPHARQRPWRS